jgi:hypothetical protein
VLNAFDNRDFRGLRSSRAQMASPSHAAQLLVDIPSCTQGDQGCFSLGFRVSGLGFRRPRVF